MFKLMFLLFIFFPAFAREAAKTKSMSGGESTKIAMPATGNKDCLFSMRESISDDQRRRLGFFKPDNLICNEQMKNSKTVMKNSDQLRSWARTKYQNKISNSYLSTIDQCRETDLDNDYLLVGKSIYYLAKTEQTLSLGLDQLASIDNFLPGGQKLVRDMNCEKQFNGFPEVIKKCKSYQSRVCIESKPTEQEFASTAAEVALLYPQLLAAEKMIESCDNYGRAAEARGRNVRMEFSPEPNQYGCNLEAGTLARAFRAQVLQTYPFVASHEFRQRMKTEFFDINGDPRAATKRAIYDSLSVIRKVTAVQIAKTKCRVQCFSGQESSQASCDAKTIWPNSFVSLLQGGVDHEDDVCSPQNLRSFFEGGIDLPEDQTNKSIIKSFVNLMGSQPSGREAASLLQQVFSFESADHVAAAQVLGAQACYANAAKNSDESANVIKDGAVAVGLVAVSVATGGVGTLAGAALMARVGTVAAAALDVGSALYYTSQTFQEAKQSCERKLVTLSSAIQKVNTATCPRREDSLPTATRDFDSCLMKTFGTTLEGLGVGIAMRGGRQLANQAFAPTAKSQVDKLRRLSKDQRVRLAMSEVAPLSTPEKVRMIKQETGVDLTAAQIQSLETAHQVGGLNRAYKYTEREIAAKDRLLANEIKDPQLRQYLILRGYAGGAVNEVPTRADLLALDRELFHSEVADLTKIPLGSPAQAKAENAKVLENLRAWPQPEVSASGRKTAATLEEAYDLHSRVSENPVSQLCQIGKYDPHKIIGFCFGRAVTAHLEALRMGMDKDQIRKIFVVGNLKGKVSEWEYHVATMVRGEKGQWFVIDPTLRRPVTVENWEEIVKEMYDKIDDNMRLYSTRAERFDPYSIKKYNQAEMEIGPNAKWTGYNGFFPDLMGTFKRWRENGQW